MDSYTIFYSWQSDYDYSKAHIKGQKKVHNQNKNEMQPLSQKDLILKVLQWQAYMLGKNHNCNITVDMDTDNTTGMQPISDIVVKKIRKCQFFVCDVTPISHIDREEDGKRSKLMPNSNVMFELGVAMSYLPPDQIIAVAHEKTGDWIISELPFDISHRKIIKFKSTTDLEKDLSSALDSSITEYRSNKGRLKRFLRSCTNLFKSSPSKENRTQNELAVLYNSEMFFNNKMGFSFPGIRGLKLVDKSILNKFFKEPISNSDVSPITIIDKFGKYPIKQFKDLPGEEIFLIGNTEVYLPYTSSKPYSDIIVYRHRKDSTFQFLFIISSPNDLVDCFYCIDENKKMVHDYNYEKCSDSVQEYATVFYENSLYAITKNYYIDVSINSCENLLSQKGRFEFRRRYLRESKLLIVPTDSIFNEKVYNDIIEILSHYDFHGNRDTINECEERLNTYFQTIISSKEQKRKWR